MVLTGFMLIAGERSWQIAALGADTPAGSTVAIPPDADANQIATELATALSRLGHTGQPAILALPSAWCLVAPISLEGLPKNDRKALLFRLEEKLPLAAEAIVADFVQTGTRALGVCCRVDRLLPLLEALEAKNIAVQSIVPAAILAAQTRAGIDPRARLLLFAEDQQVNVMALESGTLVDWSLVPGTDTDLSVQIDVLSMELGTNPAVSGIGVSNALLTTAARSVGKGNVSVLRSDLVGCATRMAVDVVAATHRPWIDLRRGPLAIRDPIRLYRRPMNTALATAGVFMLVLAGAMLFRSYRYDRKTDDYEQQMAEVFHRQFPNWGTPPNVRAVLESETRKLLAQAPVTAAGVAGDSAMEILKGVLGDLPATVRIRLERLSFLESSFEIEGKLRTYEDLDAIAGAVRKAGLEVPPPQVRRDKDGFWSFTLRGSKPAKAAPSRPGSASTGSSAGPASAE